MFEKLAYDKKEAMGMLGVKQKVFNRLKIPYTLIGKRKKYLLDDLKDFLTNNRHEGICQSVKGKARRITGTASHSTVIGFAEALKRTTGKQPRI